MTPPVDFHRWPFWRRWFGARSERVAAKFLRSLGYRIVAANLADRGGEIDLLALDGTTLVIVEVRSRAVADPQAALVTVGLVKQRKLTAAALRFLARRRLLDAQMRFDVLAIGWPPEAKTPNILHVKGAFEATGRFQMFS